MKDPIALRAARRAAMLLSLAFLPHAAIANFSGSDPLASKSPNWKPFETTGGGKLVFQNSRLEYNVQSPTSEDRAAIRWTPNEGGYNEDWFVQVAVHRNDFKIKKNGFVSLSLKVIDSGNHDRQYSVAINRSMSYVDAFSGSFPLYFNTISACATEPASSCAWEYRDMQDITLRIHFNSRAKTLTGSWNHGFEWIYFKPTDISGWKMSEADTFIVALAGTSECGNNSGPVVEAGDVHFTNFKAGNTKAEIVVSQPLGSDLTDGGKRSFGTVSVGRSSWVKTYTIRNDGTANLTNLSITKSGANATDFITTGPSKVTLKPGASTTFTARFSPKATGTRNAAIHLSNSDPNESPFDIRLTGQGVK